MKKQNEYSQLLDKYTSAVQEKIRDRDDMPMLPRNRLRKAASGLRSEIMASYNEALIHIKQLEEQLKELKDQAPG